MPISNKLGVNWFQRVIYVKNDKIYVSGTFIPSLVLFGQLASEQKTFERKNIENSTKTKNKKKKTTVWPLSSIFVTAAIFFDQSKIDPHISSMHNTLRNIYTKFSSILSGSVWGEEFQKKWKKKSKRAITQTWLNIFTRKFDHR